VDRDRLSHALIRQMEILPFLALDVADRAIGRLPWSVSIERDLDRKAAWRFLSDDADGAYGLAPRPLSDSLKTFLAEGLVTQSHCPGLCHTGAINA
jgi:hypothetical protein